MARLWPHSLAPALEDDMITYWQLTPNGYGDLKWSNGRDYMFSRYEMLVVWNYTDYRMGDGSRLMVEADAMRYYPA